MAAAVLWWAVKRPPAPVDAAKILGDHLVAGELEWLYDRSLEKDRKVTDFNLGLFNAFYDEFLRPLLSGAKAGSAATVYAGANKGVITITISKSDGTTATFDCMAFVENGEMRFPLFDAMMFAYADLKYPDVMPGLSARLEKAWHEVGPWLLNRGIEKYYVSQDDTMLSVRAMMPKVKQ